MKIFYQNFAISVWNGLYRGVGQSHIQTLKQMSVDPIFVRLLNDPSPDFQKSLREEYGLVAGLREYPLTEEDRQELEWGKTNEYPFDYACKGEKGVVHAWDNIPAKTENKQVVTVHDTFLYADKYKHFNTKDTFDIGKNIEYFKKYADVFVTPSQFSADDFSEEFPELRGRVRIIPWGSKYSKKDIVKKECEDYVLFVSCPERRKNFVNLIRAWDKIKTKTKLVVVADFNILDEEVRKEIAPYSKRKYLQFTGLVDDASLAELYSNAKGLIMPSEYEGFGMPVVEAASLGCPVACSNTSSLKEFSDFTIQFNPMNPYDIADALVSLLDDNHSKMIKAGHRATEKTFNYEKTAKEYMKIYEELS